jgi:hypothetical protein
MSRGSRVLGDFCAWRKSVVIAGRSTAVLFNLEVMDHLSLLAMGVHLGLTIGIDLLLSEVVGAAAG